MTAQDTSDVNAPVDDSVNHPRHYNVHPSGTECIDIAELLSFNLGNCLKYCWRAGEKADAAEDLRKALWYLDRENSRLNQCTRAERDEEATRSHRHVRLSVLMLRLEPLADKDFAASVAVRLWKAEPRVFIECYCHVHALITKRLTSLGKS